MPHDVTAADAPATHPPTVSAATSLGDAIAAVAAEIDAALDGMDEQARLVFLRGVFARRMPASTHKAATLAHYAELLGPRGPAAECNALRNGLVMTEVVSARDVGRTPSLREHLRP